MNVNIFIKLLNMKTFFYLAIVSMILSVSVFSYAAKLVPSTESKETVAPPAQPEASVFATPETPTVAAPDFKDAFKAFKSLSRAERKERIRAAKDEIKAFKEQQKAGQAASTNTLLLVILALLLPPLAVYLHEGVINSKFWISLLLTLLFFIPGVIYALIVILGHGG